MFDSMIQYDSLKGEKEMKELKVKGLSLLSAGVMLISGYGLGTMSNARAEGINTGTKVEETTNENEETKYVEHVVQKGDNASKISREMCKHYGIEVSNKYWPVIAYINAYPRIIKPGDVIKYPEDFETTEKTYLALRKTGWLARYIQKNNIYYKNDLTPRDYTVADVIEEIYGGRKSQNYTLVEAYLDAVGINDEFDSDTDVRDPEKLFKLTDWIPTEEELLAYGYNPALNPKKGKTR